MPRFFAELLTAVGRRDGTPAIPDVLRRTFGWIRFGLRTMFVAVAILCLPLVWLGRQMHEARDIRQVARELERLGCYVRLEASTDAAGWTGGLLGEDLFVDVVMIESGRRPFTDRMLARVAGLPHLEWLLVDSEAISSAGLASLARMSRLEHLHLAGSHIDDAALGHLQGLYGLRWLGLDRTRVTAAGVDRLRRYLPRCDIHWNPPELAISDTPRTR